MPLTKNTAGQMYALTVFTPIEAEHLAKLEATLAKLSGTGPFSRLTSTHFARLVVVPSRSRAGAPAVQSLPAPYLLFSATFDGELDPYLDALCHEMATEAEEIWSCCLGAPDPARGAALKDYLIHNQIQTGLFFSDYPTADVGTVVNALAARDKMISLAIRGQGMAPEELQRAFLEDFAQ